MKTLKFNSVLVPLIEAGTKTTTWRFYDDKDLQVGDSLTFFTKETGVQFGVATVRGCDTKTLRTLSKADWQGHERFDSSEQLLETYRSYYGPQVELDTPVKVVSFAFTPKIFNPVVVVNEADEVIGSEYMPIAIEKGLIRRAASVLVRNELGEILIQTRSLNINHPGKLDQSAAGHVDAGETYEVAAARELAEELGLSDVTLTAFGEPLHVTNFYIQVFTTEIPKSTPLAFDSEEVAAVTWYDPATLKAELAAHPVRFTLTCREVFAQLGTKILP